MPIRTCSTDDGEEKRYELPVARYLGYEAAGIDALRDFRSTCGRMTEEFSVLQKQHGRDPYWGGVAKEEARHWKRHVKAVQIVIDFFDPKVGSRPQDYPVELATYIDHSFAIYQFAVMP